MKLSHLAPFAAALALVLAGCGGSERPAAVRDVPSTGASSGAAVPTATATTSLPAPAGAGGSSGPTSGAGPQEPATTTGAAPDPGGASAEATQPGGAGDEEPIRQPARFTLAGADVRPGSIAVAPFLAVALTVVNQDAVSRAVRLVGTDVAFDVPAGGRVDRRLPGLKAGVYTLSVDGGNAVASLVVGDEAGP